jgi:hypothetical protein
MKVIHEDGPMDHLFTPEMLNEGWKSHFAFILQNINQLAPDVIHVSQGRIRSFMVKLADKL